MKAHRTLPRISPAGLPYLVLAANDFVVVVTFPPLRFFFDSNRHRLFHLVLNVLTALPAHTVWKQIGLCPGERRDSEAIDHKTWTVQ